MASATAHNRDIYDRLWPHLSDFIRYHPGARHRRRLSLQLLRQRPFSSLLDVGCGNAAWLRILAAEFPQAKLAGVDLSAVVIEQNRQALPTMTFQVADVVAAPLSGQHDVVTCCEVLEHLDDPGLALRHIAAAVAPGGHVLVTTPHGPVFKTERAFGHVAHPNRDHLDRMAADAGLTITHAQRWGFPSYRLTKMMTNVRAEAAMTHFAGDRRYSLVDKAICAALYAGNWVNFDDHARGVQWLVMMRKDQP
jgi:2-polyprenyl-3-methyl-5-hydroxy-6-metoxy-1,4-benzoquinol methylase